MGEPRRDWRTRALVFRRVHKRANQEMAKKKNGRKKPGAGKTAASPPSGGTIDGKAEDVGRKKPSTSPFEFMQQVRNEGAKVTWTSRNETLVSSIMVLIMVMIMGVFFFFVDQILRFGVSNILSITPNVP